MKIKGFEKYKISKDGKVYSSYINKNRKINTDKKGYNFILLYKNGKQYQKKIHRLVAEHYIPNPFNLPQINHKDGDKQNNHISNLEWVSNKDNVIHFYKLNGSKNHYKIIYAKNIETNETLEFESHKEAMKYFGYNIWITRKYGNVINKNIPIKNWIFYRKG